MKQKSLRARLSLSYAGIAFLAVVLLGLILFAILIKFYLDEEKNFLTHNAMAVSQLIGAARDQDFPDGVQQWILESAGFITNTQIRLVATNETVVLESVAPMEWGSIFFDNYFYNGVDTGSLLSKEKIPPGTGLVGIEKASGLPGYWITIPGLGVRINEPEKITLERSTQVIRAPIYRRDGKLSGYIELSNGPAYGREIMRSVAWGWAISALVAVTLAAAVGIWMGRKFSMPLENLMVITSQMAAGDLSARSTIKSQDEFGKLAITFNQMAEIIEAKVATLRRFVADAAHELYTPLTALRTNLELVDDALIPQALSQVERMATITQNLLDLSKIEAGAADAVYEEVDIAALLRNTVEPFASRADQAGLDFNVDMEQSSLSIRGNPNELSILIKNLLDNAIKFTPAGGEVNVKLNKVEPFVRLYVSDTGIGIPEADMPLLFSRFRRGRNASGYPGSGLGLAIVKTITDQHKATIDVKSDSGGTVFAVSFLLQKADKASSIATNLR